ncbi:T9SS type A sorting domain-containing protein [Lentimicrobium sp. L6]|uniref:T9SS-dependent choice-of-anchor J family protein n=1 Tax=Lentimicrobium sp. L6 TaxID=2735916 RepID=UPI001554AAC9|nr:choice-of-anchor J domain-containing protein [Lentimicrobium sp. L6]NPD83684.1 T9SS type A sorting domain-containing protein [Lentimicrobium sp. L6]
MKTWLMLVSFMLIGTSMFAQSDWKVALYDSWGDGWNGNSLTVYVDGVAVVTDATIEDGDEAEFVFSVMEGSEITAMYDGGGSYQSENSYEIINAYGDVLISKDDEDIVAGELMAYSALALNPDVLALDEWAVGAWQEGSTVELVSSGNLGVNLKGSDLDDADDAFKFTALSLPMDIEPGESAEVEFMFDGDAAGAFEAIYVATTGASKSVFTARINVESYVANTGDVVEDPFDAATITFPHAVAVADIKDNYNTPASSKVDGTKDAVYAFTLTTDDVVNVSSTNVDANFAIYAADFGLTGGPMTDNSIVDGAAIVDEVLFAGNYYLVASCNTDFDVMFGSVPMPVPAIAFNPSPVDAGPVPPGVDPSNVTLTWEVDMYADEYQVLFGTEYPPTVVVMDWAPVATSYNVGSLDNNTQYFWQVNLRNTQGVATVADVWGFTTSISIPQGVTAVVADTNDVTITWDALDSKVFLSYNIFRDGVQLNADPLTTAMYVDMDVPFNMTTGYDYTVTAVYDEGESEHSTAVNVMINGAGYVNGVVTELLTTGQPISGATVTFASTSATGETYVFTSDAVGAYEGMVMQDTYDITVEADGYSNASMDDVVVAYDVTVTNNFELDEYPYAPTSVTAVIQANEEDVLVSWVMPSKGILSYNIYRFDCDGGNQEFLGNVINGTQFIDNNWGGLVWGEYKYGVEVLYTNQNSAVKHSVCLAKDMDIVVDFTVTTNSDDSPAGTTISLFNTVTEEEFGPELPLGDDGLATAFPVRRGDLYEITVGLDKFDTIRESFVINNDTALFYELIEIIESPAALYVTPLGYATWVDPNALVDVTLMNESFDDGISEDWTITHNGTEAEYTWAGVESYGTSSIDGSPFAFVFSWSGSTGGFAADEVLTSAAVDASAAAILSLEFDHYYNRYNGPESGTVEVFDGANWIQVAIYGETADAGSWTSPAHEMIDITSYANADLAVRFHYVADDEFYWAVDNVKISGMAVAGKEFLNYTVWHDGNFAADGVMEPMYQYGDNPNNVLVSGETYLAEVANKYETGWSPKINYTWTYLPCDSFPGNDGMMASYVEGTANNMVVWDALDAVATINATDFEVLGTNIYRNGEMLAFVAVDASEFLDANVDPGTYTYCTEVVYSLDGGTHKWTSCTANCATDVVVPEDIFGTVSGLVYDAITMLPIEGATVTISNDDHSTVFTTIEDGTYAGNVVIGTYDYLVVANGYNDDDTQMDIVIAYGAPVVKDFAMNEFAYPVSNVHAEELSDNKVEVTWGEQAAEQWFTYDADNMVYGGLGAATGDYNLTWAIKVMPENLAALGSAFVTKVEVAQAETTGYVGDNLTEVRILSGENGETVLYTQDVTGELDLTGWTTISLDQAVDFDNTAPLWIAMYVERPADTYNEPISDPISFESDLMDLYSYNGEAWGTMEAAYGIQLSWMLRGYATTETGKEVAIGNVDLSEGSYKNYPATRNTATELMPISDEALKNFYADRTPNSIKNAKELMGYNVYRTACGSEDLTGAEFLGYTLDTQFTDNAWGTADWGIYSWAVEAVYTNNVTSEPAFSIECWDKDMLTQVNMTVTTSSGDAPTCSVLFTSTVEELEDVTANVPSSGLKTIDGFRRGTYDITVTKLGFTTIALEDVVIHDTTNFVWELVEELAVPSNLYVTPTGLATWTGLDEVEFMPFVETFDDASSFDAWEVVVGGSTSDSWVWTASYNGNDLDGTPFAFVDSDGAGPGSTMDEMLISPVIDASTAGELFIEFDQYYNNLSAQELADVEVYNGSEWVLVLHQAEDLGAWGAPDHVMIDVTEHANAEFRVRFHYVAPGWDWYWAVDNFVVTNVTGKSTKAIVEYLVYHDGANTNNTDVTMYQYGNVEAEELVSGTTYLAEVAAAYTTGISEKAAYTWTYLPCDSFPAYNYFNADGVPNSNDVLVNWSSIGGGSGSGPADYYEEFEGAFPPAGWMKANPDGGTGFEAIAAGTTPLPGWNGGEAVACPEGGAQMAYASWQQGGASSNDQWLISPMLEAYDGYELAFYMDVPYADSYLENVDILISTTGTDVADFTIVVEEMTFTSLLGWQLYTYDLVDMGLLDSGDEFYVAINEHVADNFNNGAAVLFDNFFYGAPSKMAQPQTGIIASVGGRNLNSVHAPAIDAPYQAIDVKSVNSDAVAIGTNIYRDAEFIAFVPAADTFYVDMDLEPGIYEYCAATVYTEDDGLHTWESCEGEMCDDATVEEDCVAPTNLVAQDLLGDGYTATLTWGSIDPQSEWLYYDTDVMQYTGIGAEASDYSLIWGIKFTPDMLEEYAPGYVTKISVFQGASVGDYLTEARVMSGDGMNVLYSQDVTGTLSEGWNEIELDDAVAFDNSEDLWIGFYVERPGGTANEPTSPASVSLSGVYDFFAYNGAAWTSIESQYGIGGQSWMLRGFVTNSAGKSVALGNVNTNDYTEYTSNGQTGVAMIPADPNYVGEKFDFGASSRGFLGYNIYRDGTMIEENWPTTGYSDDIGSSYEVCYTVTANYEFCGESDASNEACVTPGVGVGNLENIISVYPNPAKDYVTVEASSDILTIKVTNYMGQVISYIQDVEVTSHTIATSSYSSGVYFVEVETATGVEKVRIVISE